MKASFNLEEVAQEIRTLYRSDPEQARVQIEKYLEKRLGNLSPAERKANLGQLKDRFGGADASVRQIDLNSPLILEFISLVLGRKVTQREFETRELLDRLIRSLNTVFDSLNDLIRVIQSTLCGRGAELETIRWVIGSHLEGETESISLDRHLNQIKEAFLVAHIAFKEAARAKFQQALEELDPEAIGAASGGGLKIGPLRRAELFDIYQARFERLKAWFHSERFSEELTREFEKACQKIYANKGGHDETLS
jgi:hypothetical protein